jgi:hypothetical protein
VLVLYSPQAPGWQLLEQPPFPNSGSRLHLAVTNKLPGVYLDNTARRISQPVPHNQNEEAVRPQAGLRQPHLLSRVLVSPAISYAVTPGIGLGVWQTICMVKGGPGHSLFEYSTARKGVAKEVQYSLPTLFVTLLSAVFGRTEFVQI